MGHGGGNGITGYDFRGRNDDGDETGATWIAGVNENWEQRPDRNFRVRLSIARSVFTLFSMFWWLYYRKNKSGDWAQVTTSSNVVRSVPTIHYDEADDCTQQLPTTPDENFIVDNNGMIENANTGSVLVEWTGLPAGTESEFCIQIVGEDVNAGDEIELRGQNGSAAWGGGYFFIPNITVDKPATIRRMIIIQ